MSQLDFLLFAPPPTHSSFVGTTDPTFVAADFLPVHVRDCQASHFQGWATQMWLQAAPLTDTGNVLGATGNSGPCLIAKQKHDVISSSWNGRQSEAAWFSFILLALATPRHWSGNLCVHVCLCPRLFMSVVHAAREFMGDTYGPVRVLRCHAYAAIRHPVLV